MCLVLPVSTGRRTICAPGLETKDGRSTGGGYRLYRITVAGLCLSSAFRVRRCGEPACGLADQCDPCPRRGVSAIPPRASGHPTFHQRPPPALQRSLLAVRRRTVVPRRRRPSCHVPPTGPPNRRTRAPVTA